jgi:hypothetical protein
MAYDPSNPPPDPISIPLAEYDHMKAEISKLYDCHKMLRAVRPLVYGDELTDDELAELRMDFDHFSREYL